jgi:NAD(P)-dependent dehydrogenase (short-subunit alcohol dehydrogenase family)
MHRIQATATIFAREGAKVFCADLNQAAAEKTAKDINDAAGKVVAIAMGVNVSNPKQVEGMIKAAEKEFGKVNVIFNNAGLMHGSDDDAINTEDDVWDLTMNVNVKGVWYGCKYGIPALRRGKIYK